MEKYLIKIYRFIKHCKRPTDIIKNTLIGTQHRTVTHLICITYMREKCDYILQQNRKTLKLIKIKIYLS